MNSKRARGTSGSGRGHVCVGKSYFFLVLKVGNFQREKCVREFALRERAHRESGRDVVSRMREEQSHVSVHKVNNNKKKRK